MGIFFCKRADNLFATIFADLGLSCKWCWKRCEFQKRGTAHIPGYFCLDCAPNNIKFAKIFLKACMTAFCINKYEGREFTTGERISFPEDNTYSD